MRAALLLSIILILTAPTLRANDDKTTNANTDTCTQYLQKALQYERGDSIIQAAKMYAYMYADKCADTTYLREQFNRCAARYAQQAQNSLQGKWRWTWSGSNWGTEDEPNMCKCTRSLVFDGAWLKMYSNDSLVRETKYEVITDGAGIRWLGLPRLNESPVIRLLDTGDIWATMYGESWRVSEEGLHINKTWGCVCGCNEEIYEPVIE